MNQEMTHQQTHQTLKKKGNGGSVGHSLDEIHFLDPLTFILYLHFSLKIIVWASLCYLLFYAHTILFLKEEVKENERNTIQGLLISFLFQSCLTGPSIPWFFLFWRPQTRRKRKNSRTDCVLFSFHESVFLRERMAFGPNLRLIRSLFRNRSLKWKEKAWAVKKKRKRKLYDRSLFSFMWSIMRKVFVFSFLFFTTSPGSSSHSFSLSYVWPKERIKRKAKRKRKRLYGSFIHFLIIFSLSFSFFTLSWRSSKTFSCELIISRQENGRSPDNEKKFRRTIKRKIMKMNSLS